MGLSLPRPLAWFAKRRRRHVQLGAHGPFGIFKTSLPLADFDTHLYVVGQTGKGKSQFLNHLAFQLVVQDQGVGLIDPHGDLVSDLLAYLASYPRNKPWLSIPENRQRVIYFDPNRTDYVVPFNPLAVEHAKAYVTAQAVVEAFKRTWHEELRAAPRFANLALYSLLVLIKARLSLVELSRLLTDKPYRRQLLERVDDQRVLEFFTNRFDRWGREAPLMIESLLNKATALTLNPYLYLVLGAASSLSLRAIMDEGKILLVNLRTPEEETKNLLGSLLMTAFEQAALSRETLPKLERRRFFLIVDEFQKFCANSGSVATLAEILSECRKYGLHLCFAHQSWAQLSSHSRLIGALEQAQIRAVFGTGRHTAQAIAAELFNPDPKSVKHEVEDEEQQPRSHPLFSSIPEQLEVFTQSIQRLKRRAILVQLPERDGVLHLRTLTVPKPRISQEELEQIKLMLARQVGRPRAEVEREIAARATPPTGEAEVYDYEQQHPPA